MLRKAAGLGLGELAEQIGVDRKTLQRLESGNRQPGREISQLQDAVDRLKRQLGMKRGRGRPPVLEERPVLDFRKVVDRDLHAWVQKKGGAKFVLGLIETAYREDRACQGW